MVAELLGDIKEKSAATADIKNVLWRRAMKIQILHAGNV